MSPCMVSNTWTTGFCNENEQEAFKWTCTFVCTQCTTSHDEKSSKGDNLTTNFYDHWRHVKPSITYNEKLASGVAHVKI